MHVVCDVAWLRSAAVEAPAVFALEAEKQEALRNVVPEWAPLVDGDDIAAAPGSPAASRARVRNRPIVAWRHRCSS